jgi:hypothetical protein
MTPAQMRERIVEILDSINMPEVADRYRTGSVSVRAKH